MISALFAFLRGLPQPWGSIVAFLIGAVIAVPMLIYLYRSENKRWLERKAALKQREDYVRSLEAQVASLQTELEFERNKNKCLTEVAQGYAT